MAEDIPFVFFGEKSSAEVGFTTNQLKNISASYPDLAAVPPVSTAAENEVLKFSSMAGGDTIESKGGMNVGALKEAIGARIEPNNSLVHDQAVVLAAKYPGDYTIDQICAIYSYLKKGVNSTNGWSYVSDPRGTDYFMYANETIIIGKNAGCSGAGDCDDFAILIASLVESIGGTTRIILANNGTIVGHVYCEVYLGQLNARTSQVNDMIDWLRNKYNSDKIFVHVDTDTKDVWLNLDWGADEEGNAHPGGPFYQGDRQIVLCIKDTFGRTPLKMPTLNHGRVMKSSAIPLKNVTVPNNATAYVSKEPATKELINITGTVLKISLSTGK